MLKPCSTVLSHQPICTHQFSIDNLLFILLLPSSSSPRSCRTRLRRKINLPRQQPPIRSLLARTSPRAPPATRTGLIPILNRFVLCSGTVTGAFACWAGAARASCTLDFVLSLGFVAGAGEGGLFTAGAGGFFCADAGAGGAAAAGRWDCHCGGFWGGLVGMNEGRRMVGMPRSVGCGLWF